MTFAEPPNKDSIQLLSGRDAARLMPGMYVGGTDQRALHRAVWSLVEAAIDELLTDERSHLFVIIEANNVVTISNDGSGLAIEAESGQTRSLSEKIVTFSGFFTWHKIKPTKRPIVMFYGVAITNALAAYFVLQLKRDGYFWEQIFQKGLPQSSIQKVRELAPDEGTGTTFIFQPDFTIFQPNDISHLYLYRRLREVAFLLPMLTISFEDRRPLAAHPQNIFAFPGGVEGFVRFINRDFPVLHAPIVVNQTLQIEAKKDEREYEVVVEIALQYAETAHSLVLGFVNGINTPDGGIHVEEMLGGLANVITTYAELKMAQLWSEWQEDDIRVGLTAIISVWHPGPHFVGSFSRELEDGNLEYQISPFVKEAIRVFAEESPTEMQNIVDRCLAQSLIRERRHYGDIE